MFHRFVPCVSKTPSQTPPVQVAYPSVEAAMAAAKTGEVWGVVSLLPSFSRDLLYRVVNVSTTQV
jgi:hypothetical protein